MAMTQKSGKVTVLSMQPSGNDVRFFFEDGTVCGVTASGVQPNVFTALYTTILTAAAQNWWIEVQYENPNDVRVIDVNLAKAFVH